MYKEKMNLFHFYMQPSMNANLELTKRLTGVSKSVLIRAAIEEFIEKKLKEYEPMILAMDKAIRGTDLIN